MKTESTAYGWTVRQWAKAAEYHCLLGHGLPKPGDPLTVFDTWYERRADDPADPSPIVLVNVLGQVREHVVGLKYRLWSIQVVRHVARECGMDFPMQFHKEILG